MDEVRLVGELTLTEDSRAYVRAVIDDGRHGPQPLLGSRYRDRLTGFEGIAVSAHEYLYGCRRITLERMNDKGDALVSITFDAPQLDFMEEVERFTERPVALRTGGPHDHDSIIDRH